MFTLYERLEVNHEHKGFKQDQGSNLKDISVSCPTCVCALVAELYQVHYVSEATITACSFLNPVSREKILAVNLYVKEKLYI